MTRTFLKACLNGSRSRASHPRCPITAAELARDAVAAVEAGAEAVHVHPRDSEGRESLQRHDVATAVEAIKGSVGVPVGVTTGAWIVGDPSARLEAVAAWSALPDFASVNFHEAGAVELAELLLRLGVEVEAGVWDMTAAQVLSQSGLAPRCLRILLEPNDQTVTEALVTVGEIDAVLEEAAADVPRLLHGVDATAWALLDEAARRGDAARIGLEDTLVLPEGRMARDNAELVRVARARLDQPEGRAG